MEREWLRGLWGLLQVGGASSLDLHLPPKGFLIFFG